MEHKSWSLKGPEHYNTKRHNEIGFWLVEEDFIFGEYNSQMTHDGFLSGSWGTIGEQIEGGSRRCKWNLQTDIDLKLAEICALLQR
jgi:hypothetical protein